MDGGAVKVFVSSGPIELKRDGSLRFMPRSGQFNVWSLLGAAMGVCSVAVFVAGVVYFWKIPKSVY
ncbi:UNVERIFIED_CONTAM: hypothetical protein FKN15_030449 [Acipenser sinensis]